MTTAAAPARIFPSDNVHAKLPNEVWLAIFTWVYDSGASLTASSIVCKRFSVLTAPLRYRRVSLRLPPTPAPAHARAHAHAHALGVGEDSGTRLANLLSDPDRALGPHTRSLTISSRNPTGAQGHVPPPSMLRALATMTNLERIELTRLELSGELIRTLSSLPNLTSLALVGCVPPKSPVLQSIKACKLALSSITIDNVMKHVYLFEDLLALLCSPSTRSVTLRGGDPVPSFFLRTLGNQLTHHTLHHLELPFEGMDGRVLADFLNNQRTLRHLTCTSRTFPRLPLPEGALPHLERFDGPDSPEAYELLARARPLRAVSINPVVYSTTPNTNGNGNGNGNGATDRLARAFRGLQHASKPLTFLSLRVASLDAGLMALIVRSFPDLETLAVRSMTTLSEELLRDALPTQLRFLPALQALTLESIPQGPDESFARPTPPQIELQNPLVLSFSQAAKGLRRIGLDRVEWVCAGNGGEEGDWTAYDVTPGFGDERERWDVPVGFTRDRALTARDGATPMVLVDGMGMDGIGSGPGVRDSANIGDIGIGSITNVTNTTTTMREGDTGVHTA